MNENIATVQREVQRKLGRCLLRLQEIERLLKNVVPRVSVQGNAKKILDIRDKKIADARVKTMGALVSLLTEELLTTPATIEISENDLESIDQANWLSIKFRISMSDEEFEETRQALVDLVDMRNGLVHHFLERFDLSSISECHKADAYLVECDAKIDSQSDMLRQFAKDLIEGYRSTSTYFDTTEFLNAFVHGVMPNGEVHWERSTIVEYLRNAEMSCAVHGWTLLDNAIVHINMNDREQSPSKYGCKTWQEVLKKSAQFDIKKDVNSSNGRGQVWYRSLEFIQTKNQTLRCNISSQEGHSE